MLLQLLQEQNITLQATTAHQAHIYSYSIDICYWQQLALYAKKTQCRFAAMWAQQFCQPTNIFRLTVCLEENNNYLLFSADLPSQKPAIISWTNSFSASIHFERHIRDLYGITFTDTIDKRRWTRHKAWRDYEFPLTKNYQPPSTTAANLDTPPNAEYHFTTIESSSICEVPVGPVHAGIIEPGHFRFNVDGEDILRLEARLGYVHKGIEKIAENKTIHELLRLAARVSGDSTVAHSWALCRACEDSYIDIPPRALHLRAIMAERERVANHIGDMGALCNDVGFAFANYQMGRLRELWQRTNQKIFGHRFMMDQLVYGGVRHDISTHDSETMLQQIITYKKELAELYTIIENNNSLQDRFVTTGILSPNKAQEICAIGYVGKASEQSFDARHNTAYAPYDQLNVNVPCFDTGDVAARFNIRAQETLTALEIIVALLKTLPPGKINLAADASDDELALSLANREGFGYVEGWRGETLAYVRFNEQARVERYFPRDPSWLTWPALEELVHNNIIPDFPLCNKSVNASYAGSDL